MSPSSRCFACHDHLQQATSPADFSLSEVVSDWILRAAVELMLTDRRGCVVSVPLRYGEVRYIAAHTLAAERRVAGIAEPLVVEVVAPVDALELERLDEAMQGLERPRRNRMQIFDALNEAGRLPLEQLKL